MRCVTERHADPSGRRARLRRRVNLLTLATPLGLALARWGRATVVPGPDGLLLAGGWSLRLVAPRAGAVTVGDVVLLRCDVGTALARPGLLAHEGRHAAQWARWLGPLGFLPAYGLASAWSWLRCRDAAVRNPFEVRAGLVDGGYAGRAAAVAARRPGGGDQSSPA
jgi:hypothetical protein